MRLRIACQCSRVIGFSIKAAQKRHTTQHDTVAAYCFQCGYPLSFSTQGCTLAIKVIQNSNLRSAWMTPQKIAFLGPRLLCVRCEAFSNGLLS